jgi:integrase
MEPGFNRPWRDDRRSANFIGAESCLAIRQRDAYQTRHTFAMLALMASASPMWVARQLGDVNRR